MLTKISLLVVDIPDKYTQGNILTENEAYALNQLRRNNIANNLKRIAQQYLSEANGDITKAKAAFEPFCTNYTNNYDFIRKTPTTNDPIIEEAKKLARSELPLEAIENLTISQKDHLVSTVIAKNPSLLERAKAIVTARKALAKEALL